MLEWCHLSCLTCVLYTIGAVYTEKFGTAVINSSAFHGNKAVFGGSVCLLQSALGIITNSSFSGCTASYDGAAVYLDSSILQMNLTRLLSNRANDYGVVCIQCCS
jgi:hypothetical protein